MKNRVLYAALIIALIILMSAASLSAPPPGRTVIPLSGSGWRVWLDKNAAWQTETIYAPPADVSAIPSVAPTPGWDILKAQSGKPAAVPGTVEEYFGTGNGPDESLQGVSWWYRTIDIPAFDKGRCAVLTFESANLRAEVYVNQTLVAYNLVGGIPFEADITDAVTPGRPCLLAVRITNPGGTYSYNDTEPIRWGKTDQYILKYHAFSGITGRVNLEIRTPVFIEDLYIQNTPEFRTVNAYITLENTLAGSGSGPQTANLTLTVRPAEPGRKELFTAALKDVPVNNPLTTEKIVIAVPDADLWHPDHPSLYVCSVALDSSAGADTLDKRFGFRWFDVQGIGEDAIFTLNGKRIVLKSAISWSFWPVNGIYPTEELAEKQIRTAKSFGMNMLHFHRAIGQPLVFDKADELGLLYYQEPGGYTSGAGKPVGQAMAREKLLAMVKRDRSRPSLVIYNMINEQWQAHTRNNPALLEQHRQDLIDAHALDPGRIITYTSAWSDVGESQTQKMHMRPFDDTVYTWGWYDFHRAMGPSTWEERFYKSPTDQYCLVDAPGEIIFWGEDGAMSTPPRLGLIKKQIETQTNPGWDSRVYLEWHDIMDRFLENKNLKSVWPSVDALCSALGRPSLEHQGRKFELTRIGNLPDGYAINGWEAQLINNHSGVVDIYRNPKSDPAVIAWYNRPLHLAVMLREQVMQTPAVATADIFVANDIDLGGPAELRILVDAPGRPEVFQDRRDVTLAGGSVYGQLLAEAVRIPVDREGLYTVRAYLFDPAGRELVSGRNELLAVDAAGMPLKGRGAVYAFNDKIRDYINTRKKLNIPAFDGSQEKLDWILIARPMDNEPYVVTPEYYCGPDGQPAPVQTAFFNRNDFGDTLLERTDPAVDTAWIEGVPPDTALDNISYYSVRFEGYLLPPVDGDYAFAVRAGFKNTAALWLDGKKVIDSASRKSRSREQTDQVTVTLEARKPVSVKVESYQARFPAGVKLLWLPPGGQSIPASEFIRRCRLDGTSLIVIRDTAAWAGPLARASWGSAHRPFDVGENWVGGKFFVTDHPLFRGLPVNAAMDWPYQALFYKDCEKYALTLEGGRLVAGAWQSLDCRMGTAVGLYTCGRGKIILSTLDITRGLLLDDGPSAVSRKLLYNFINFSAP